MTSDRTMNTEGTKDAALLAETNQQLRQQNEELKLLLSRKIDYIRAKTNQLLVAMGTAPVRPEELDDETLLELDPIGIVCESFRQVIETLNETNQQLREREELLAVTLRSIGDGVIATDIEGKILLINKVAKDLLGLGQEEGCGLHIDEVLKLYDAKTGDLYESVLTRALQTVASSSSPPLRLLSKDGSIRSVAESAAPIYDKDSNVIGTVVVFRDISEQQKMEANLLRAQKLESVGILAGGIAHDFNNLLTGVFGNISLAKEYIDPANPAITRLSAAEAASSRARDLTQQLLTFSKGGAPVKKTASIAELLNDSAGFALRGSNVICNLEMEEGLWNVEMDVGQINQVIHNLIINADQAMPSGGQIIISARNRNITTRDALPLVDGDYVEICVSDSGVGISPEDLERIFDPYFTTKDKGTGLGLATSYSIIKNHDGTIMAESKPGKGTVFTIMLPASSQLPLPVAELPVLRKGEGRILVMDDEEIVREVAGSILDHAGYSVEFAVNGEEALAAYVKAMEEQQPFAAVIMDLTIPGAMGGAEAIEKLLKIDPKVKALVSSGYSNDPIMAECRKYGFKGVVLKPYRVDELVQALQAVLSLPSPPE